MSNSRQIQLPGVTVTYGDCDDPKYTGMKFVSIGSKEDHTTFIVSPDYATVFSINMRGADKLAWRVIALAETSGYWD